MDSTPKAKTKLSCRRINSNASSVITETSHLLYPPINTATSTPIRQQFNIENEHSPLYFTSTQEVIDDLDVVWDWNSPHSLANKVQRSKRTNASKHVDKVPIKRHPSNTQIQTFDKLKSDLEALRNQLVCDTTNKPADRDRNSLDFLVAPLRNDVKDHEEAGLEEFFEDNSVEEQMLLCSQKIESTISIQTKDTLKVNKICNPVDEIKSDCDKQSAQLNQNKKIKSNAGINCNKRLDFNSKVRKENKRSRGGNQQTAFGNDSLDMVLETFEEKDFNELLSQQPMENVRVHCDNTQSKSRNTATYNLKDIESKQLEALEKLQAKRKQGILSPIKKSPEKTTVAVNLYNANETSPIKCSPEEIEQKRLQALAKLEAKKKQDVMEKNRREALKRLEMNKRKRVIDSQRSLVSRTYSR